MVIDDWEEDIYWPFDSITPRFIQLLLTISKDTIRPRLINYFNNLYYNMIDASNYYVNGFRFITHDNTFALTYMQPDWLEPGVPNFSYAPPVEAVLTVAAINYGCITAEFINNAKTMLTVLNSKYPIVNNQIRLW